jgi:hypothetical protein
MYTPPNPSPQQLRRYCRPTDAVEKMNGSK